LDMQALDCKLRPPVAGLAIGILAGRVSVRHGVAVFVALGEPVPVDRRDVG
jgi:hypothetical protein